LFAFLGRLFIALFVLFFARLFFAAARGMTRRSGGSAPRTPSTPRDNAGVGGVGGAPSRRPAPPRIDRSTAEDVPFVELGAERAEHSERPARG
jgi:hypothetical protein